MVKAKNVTTKEFLKKSYHCENKDRIRRIIIDEIRKRDIKTIVTLESPEFIFSNLLPDKKIIVFEKEAEVIERMEKKCPKNVELIFGNINKFNIFNSKADMIYLDFCKTWMTEQENVIKMVDCLKKTKLFGITLCLRETAAHKEKGFTFFGDHQFDLLKQLQTLTGINWRVVYGESYYDSVQMITILLENQEVSKS